MSPPQLPLLQFLVPLAHFSLAAIAAGHALMYKRDPRAALGWVSVSLLLPFLGPLAYYMFGINRVRSKAHALHGRRPAIGYEGPEIEFAERSLGVLGLYEGYEQLQHASDTVSGRALTAGNCLEALSDGDEAYPQMLAAIAQAETRIVLSTYIFETDTVGRRFVDALAAACDRGVTVRVLVDGIGELYSLPRVTRLLARRGVPAARFLPPRLIPPALHLNLRNHRKILVADTRVAFTGGMNIGARHVSDEEGELSTRDLHFRLRGPVVSQLEEVFWDDWRFATGESAPHVPRAAPPEDGSAHCRVITDGPNQEMDRLETILRTAMTCAERSIDIVTPYFLPSRSMIAALQSAALRRVAVRIVLPEENNLQFVHWASRNLLHELLQYGIEVLYQPPPFAHTKLFVVDGLYTHVGSANIDPRSLRLNFELAVEILDRDFAARLRADLDALAARCRRVTYREMVERSLPVRLRDAFAWLFSPYL